jgi:hypothetical protein
MQGLVDTADVQCAQAQRMSAYDVWSVGVVWLELLLGTPRVFQVPPDA